MLIFKRAAAVRLKRRFRQRFLLHKFRRKEETCMSTKLTLRERLPRYYWTITSGVIALFLSLQPVFAATDIWSKFSDVMKDIYGKLLGVSTIIAVTAAAVALLVRMISRNQRAVDEATSWLKRIVVTWLILNTLGFIIAYIQPLVQGGQYTP